MLSLSDLTEDQISAVHALQGRTLKSGWHVTEMHKPKPGASGSNFSVCYKVERDGQLGFMKALNILRFVRDEDPDLLEAMSTVLENYTYEISILNKCGSKNLSKIARLIDHGKENIPGFLIANVYYLIFERAESDVRAFMNFSEGVDLIWKFQSLHGLALALQQLHGLQISHQDLKPSNAFVFENRSTKLGDLGRAQTPDLVASHSHLHFSGDPKYAPPEVLHKYSMPEWHSTAYAVDCYLLGSMIFFYFTGLNASAMLIKHLPQGFNWSDFVGRFDEALPYWEVALDRALDALRQNLILVEERDAEELVLVTRALCHPNPVLRGHPKTRQEIGSNYLLHRIPPMFDKFCMRARINLRRA